MFKSVNEERLESRAMGGKKLTRLTLESYFDFARNPHAYELTRHQLNEIIFMHGFIKIYHVQKKHFVDRLKIVKLISPIRSTLNEKTSSFCAVNDVNEAKVDMLALGWNECLVQSVETVGLQKQVICIDDEAIWSWGRKARTLNPRRKRKKVSPPWSGLELLETVQ